MYVCMFGCAYVCMYVCRNKCSSRCSRRLEHPYIHICVYACMCAGAPIYVCMHVCMLQHAPPTWSTHNRTVEGLLAFFEEPAWCYGRKTPCPPPTDTVKGPILTFGLPVLPSWASQLVESLCILIFLLAAPTSSPAEGRMLPTGPAQGGRGCSTGICTKQRDLSFWLLRHTAETRRPPCR